VALALEAAASGQTSGQLHYVPPSGAIDFVDNARALTAAGLCQALAALAAGQASSHFAWQLSWGAKLVLEARARPADLAAAA
jgi:hypothetical protein